MAPLVVMWHGAQLGGVEELEAVRSVRRRCTRVLAATTAASFRSIIQAGDVLWPQDRTADGERGPTANFDLVVEVVDVHCVRLYRNLANVAAKLAGTPQEGVRHIVEERTWSEGNDVVHSRTVTVEVA